MNKNAFLTSLAYRMVLLAVLLTLTLSSVRGAFVYHTLTTQSLLPVATVHCIYQDSEGYMWYGTRGGGLCRDNGYQVEVFRSDWRSPNRLANNNISCIAEDSIGGIWFGTEKGLYRLDKDTYQLSERLQGKGTVVSALFLDSHRYMWVGTSEGVYRINPADGKVLLHTTDNALRNVCQFTEDHRGNVWAATWNGAPYIYKESNKHFTKAPWQSSCGIVRMCEDVAQGGFWIATWGDGVVFYDARTGHVTTQALMPKNVDGSRCIDMLIDKTQGLIWVTTLDNLYLYKRTGRQLTKVNTKEFLSPGSKILDGLCEDRSGNIWVAGFTPHTFIVSNSVQSVVRESVAPISTKTGFPLLPDRMVADGKNYWIWQGRVGLMFYEPTTSRLIDAGGMNVSRSIAYDKNNAGIWAAKGKRLIHLTFERGAVVEKEAASFSSDVSSVNTQGDGNIWIGTRDGAYLYSTVGNTVRKYCSSTAKVLGIAAHSDGGIHFINADKQLVYCPCNGKPEILANPHREDFTALSLAPDATLWCATQQGSVYCLPEGEKEPQYMKKMSNANGDAIIAIKTDRTGHVWLLSNQYLREYNPRNDAFRTLRNTDSDIAVSYFYCLEVVGDNIIAANGAGAYLQFESSQMLDKRNTQGGQPYITAIQMGDSIMLLNGRNRELEVSGGTASIILRCSTFDPVNAAKVTFAYKVEGWDKDWVYLPQGVNSIYLSNLPKGKYRLLLRATDRYGCWSNGEMTYTVHRLPEWWETWWAHTIYLLMAIGACYGVWKLNRRIRLLRILQLRRKKLSLTEVHIAPDELSKNSALTEEFLRKVVEKIEEHLSDSDYNVERLSSDMCMSRMNLYRKIQAVSGLSPNEFIKDIKLKKAATILQRHPDIAVGKLAEKVGFATPKYFSKCFKAKFGVLPSQYVKSKE